MKVYVLLLTAYTIIHTRKFLFQVIFVKDSCDFCMKSMGTFEEIYRSALKIGNTLQMSIWIFYVDYRKMQFYTNTVPFQTWQIHFQVLLVTRYLRFRTRKLHRLYSRSEVHIWGSITVLTTFLNELGPFVQCFCFQIREKENSYCVHLFVLHQCWR